MPIHAEFRRERANNPAADRGYGILNGQAGLEHFWKKLVFARDDISLLLFFTDGMVTLEETKDEGAMAEMLFGVWSAGGWCGLLNRIHELPKELVKSSHVSQSEATGIAIAF